ncbi:MAG TPA: hypothetical protein VNV86_03825, partial [Candidatus Acidoferrum sp.]|nr:hypothetical protein [Candidatus Acidoferrum sp.]
MRLALLLACASAFAQTARPPARKAPAPAKKAAPDAPAPTQWPIQSLTVEGNKVFTRDQVLAVAALKVGQVAGKPEFEAARDRLVASGAFETVGYKFEPASDKQGFVATFQVVEAQPTFPVRFEELPVPGAELEAVLKAKDPLFSAANLPATRSVLDRYVA